MIKKMKQLLQKAFIILMYLFFTLNSINAQFTRGAVEDEIYISSNTYIEGYLFHQVVMHSEDNGENLSIQYENIEDPPEGVMQSGIILSDATAGTLYNFGGNKRWVSFDYGKNWEYQAPYGSGRFTSGNLEGEIYHCCAVAAGTIWRSTDYGSSFVEIRDDFKFKLEVGNSEGVVYGFGGDAGVEYNLYYSKNYGLDFDTIPIDTTVALWSMSGHPPNISRGTEPGELYLISWWQDYHYKIFHSVDTGYTWEEKYESGFIDFYYWGVGFTAGRKPGSFYVARMTSDYPSSHILLYIDYSEDYGKTFTTYFHELDEYFPGYNYHNEILSFSFNEFEPPVIGEIDEENHKVFFTVPYGTDFTSLVPTITVSQYASIEPASGVANDFSIPVTYTVTAENGDTQDYTVIGSMAENHENFILAFNFEEFEPPVIGEIQEETKFIYLAVPHGTDLTELVPTLTISENASVEPASGTANDFSDTAIYTVTAQNGDEREYRVVVWDTLNSVNNIETISLFKIFPNPSKGIFYLSPVSSMSGNYQIEIIDNTGHCLRKDKINSTNNQSTKINMVDFKNGVYYLNIYKKETRIETKKILITK